MSTALRIMHGLFGRVALLDMDRRLVRHAHPHCHVLLKVDGDDTQFLVGDRLVPLTDVTAVLVNAWQTHAYVHDPARRDALLLAQPGRVLSVDRLISVLWDDAPPKTALKNLQVYVYQLRKIVGSRLLSRPPGYLMSIDPAELDLTRFTELLDVARRERTPQRYREALALWRGPALADLAASGLLRGVIAQVEELRLAARVECAEAELDLPGLHPADLHHGRLRRLGVARDDGAVELEVGPGEAERESDVVDGEVGVHPGPGDLDAVER